MKDGKIEIDVAVNTLEIDEVTKKAERLKAILEEAKTLINEMASSEISSEFDVVSIRQL